MILSTVGRRRLDLNPEKAMASISWDRHFANGTLAPSGWYRVVAVACDVHDLCGNDTGIVEIPTAATSTATLTPSPTATITMTPPIAPTATQMPATPTSAIDIPSPEITPEPTYPVRSVPFWQLLGLLGLFLAIASASVVDPRPAALDRLREIMKLISSQRKDLSDNE